MYLPNIRLMPLPPVRQSGLSSHYVVVDGQGGRVPGVLHAPRDSFLWALAPTGSEQRYSDFGATIERIDGSNVLAICKLSN